MKCRSLLLVFMASICIRQYPLPPFGVALKRYPPPRLCFPGLKVPSTHLTPVSKDTDFAAVSYWSVRQNITALHHGAALRKMSFALPYKFFINVLSSFNRQADVIVLSLATSLYRVNARLVCSTPSRSPLNLFRFTLLMTLPYVVRFGTLTSIFCTLICPRFVSSG